MTERMSRVEHDRQAAEAAAKGLAALGRGAEVLAKGLGGLGERMRTMAESMSAHLAQQPSPCDATDGAAGCPVHGMHPHDGMVCLDCPSCPRAGA